MRDSGERSTVSLITYRGDDLRMKAEVVNDIIKSEVRRRSGISIIDHPNITDNIIIITMFIQGTNTPYKGMTVGPVVR